MTCSVVEPLELGSFIVAPANRVAISSVPFGGSGLLSSASRVSIRKVPYPLRSMSFTAPSSALIASLSGSFVVFCEGSSVAEIAPLSARDAPSAGISSSTNAESSVEGASSPSKGNASTASTSAPMGAVSSRLFAVSTALTGVGKIERHSINAINRLKVRLRIPICSLLSNICKPTS